MDKKSKNIKQNEGIKYIRYQLSCCNLIQI